MPSKVNVVLLLFMYTRKKNSEEKVFFSENSFVIVSACSHQVIRATPAIKSEIFTRENKTRIINKKEVRKVVSTHLNHHSSLIEISFILLIHCF